VDFDLSVAVYDEERMVGFTLIGVDEWEGKLAAFDAGTGIIPGFRGQGLAQKMFDHATPGLRERDVKLFLLEVLQVNDAAIRAYSKAGFEITRELSCFELDVAARGSKRDTISDIAIRSIDRDLVASFAEHVDWTPSWENGFSAIRNIPDDLLLFGAFREDLCVGVIAYSPHMNRIMSLIVQRSHRRRGIATALLNHLLDNLPGDVNTVKLTNVQKTDHQMITALTHMGFTHWIDQYEMSLPL